MTALAQDTKVWTTSMTGMMPKSRSLSPDSWLASFKKTVLVSMLEGWLRRENAYSNKA